MNWGDVAGLKRDCAPGSPESYGGEGMPFQAGFGGCKVTGRAKKAIIAVVGGGVAKPAAMVLDDVRKDVSLRDQLPCKALALPASGASAM